jgi:hypothetical protein
MRLVSFTVENYRSITSAHRIALDKAVVLIGPNNEGKSNILRALVAAMNVLTEGRLLGVVAAPRPRGFTHRRYYAWENDYPVHLQESNPEGESVVLLEFELTTEEIGEFRSQIGSALNGTLPIRVAMGASRPTVTVAKQGPGKRVLSEKSSAIADFVAKRVDIEHVPAVRTASAAESVVTNLVERELAVLEDDPEYMAALRRIEDIQKPLLEVLSNRIRSTLAQFLPAVRTVRLQIRSEARSRGLRSCDIFVDDGTPTLLRNKGDGVQSLAALGLMRHASESGLRGRHLIVAIEEPESHLHPRAIHELREVIHELGKQHQVVITTHCPLFVNRVSIGSNILVKGTKARPSRSIEEIRDALGVRAADNLRNAELVLLVEGSDDQQAMKALLSVSSDRLRQALADGALAVDFIGGAGNIPYRAASLRDSLCRCHLFLDHDAAALRGYEQAITDGTVSKNEVHFAICPGLRESEIEDLYDTALYERWLLEEYGVSLGSPKFKGKRKWAERLAATFRHQGHHWNDDIEREVKRGVAALVHENAGGALHGSRRSSFDDLAEALGKRLERLEF